MVSKDGLKSSNGPSSAMPPMGLTMNPSDIIEFLSKQTFKKKTRKKKSVISCIQILIDSIIPKCSRRLPNVFL